MAEQLGFGLEPRGERGGGTVGGLAGGAVDDDGQQVGVLRKGPVERQLVPPPADVARQHVLDVGVERQPEDDEQGGGGDQRQHDGGDGAGAAAGELGEAGGEGGDHTGFRRARGRASFMQVRRKLGRI